MNILEKYVDRMNAHDAQGIADCWVDEGCVFDDEAAKLLTGTPAYLEGKEAILATFTTMCAAAPKATIIEIAEDGKSMAYNIELVGHVLECRGTVEEEQDGKFKVYSCRPRA